MLSPFPSREAGGSPSEGAKTTILSCPELDAVVEIAKMIGEGGGMIGCRMTGAGFRGCAVSLVRTEAAARITKEIGKAYETRTTNYATISSSRPATGAKILAAR